MFSIQYWYVKGTYIFNKAETCYSSVIFSRVGYFEYTESQLVASHYILRLDPQRKIKKASKLFDPFLET